MKKFRLLSIVLIMFSAISLVSCDSEPVDPVLNGGENPDPNNPGTGVFKVDIDGETFVADNVQAQISNGLFTIVGAKTNGSVVSLSIEEAVEGTFDDALMSYIADATGSPQIYMNRNPETFQKNGTVTITEVDYENKTVSGSFSFTGYFMEGAPVVLTNGSFTDISVPGLPDEPGTTPVGQPFMKAKVDGELINFGTIMVMGEGDFWQLAGTNAASQESMRLSLKETITPGTYSLEEFTDYYAAFLSFDGASFSSESGSVTIISHADGWIKGTFSFSGEDFDGMQHSVTDGEFNIQY